MPRKPTIDDHDAPWVEEMASIFPGYKAGSIRARKSAWRNFCSFIKSKNKLAELYQTNKTEYKRMREIMGKGEIPRKPIVIRKGIHDMWVRKWIMTLVQDEMSFQSCLNYYVAVLDLLIYKGALLAPKGGYSEMRLKILHRQILTLVRSEPHKQAKPFTMTSLNSLTRNEKRIASFAIQLGVRARTLKNIGYKDITVVKEKEETTMVIYLKEVKYCPVDRPRYFELKCCCKQAGYEQFCFLHKMKIPSLPINSAELGEVCSALDSSTHCFRRTMALAIRCVHEKFGIVDVDLVNILFFWADSSRMYVTRYTHDWSKVIHQDLPVFYSALDKCVRKSQMTKWEIIKSRDLCFLPGGYDKKLNEEIDEEVKLHKKKFGISTKRKKKELVLWEDSDKKKATARKDGKYGPALMYDAENKDRWPQRTMGWVFQNEYER